MDRKPTYMSRQAASRIQSAQARKNDGIVQKGNIHFFTRANIDFCLLDFSTCIQLLRMRKWKMTIFLRIVLIYVYGTVHAEI